MNCISKKNVFIIACLLLSTLVYSQQNRKIDWKADLAFLSKELPEKHYNLFAKQTKDYFLSEITRIEKESDKLTDFEVGMNIQQLLASMGDSHTMLGYGSLFDKNQALPLKLYWFKDGLFVLLTVDEYSEILGCKITSINDVPVNAVSDKLSSLITVDNQALVKSKIPQFIPSVQLLKLFNIVENEEVKLNYENQKGENKVLVMKPVVANKANTISFKPDSLALCYKNQKAYFLENYLADDKIYYLQYNVCSSKEVEMQYGDKNKAEQLPSFQEYEDRVFKVLNSNPVEKIIFDMRFNGGGNSSQGTAFITKLSEYLKKNPNVNLYVVLGRETFSSAILNALDFKKMTKVMFVGEETGGKPNHFGEVRVFQLPNSGLSVLYSTNYFKRSDDDVNTLRPDVLIETSFSDFAKGIDPVFDWVKHQE